MPPVHRLELVLLNVLNSEGRTRISPNSYADLV